MESAVRYSTISFQYIPWDINIHSEFFNPLIMLCSRIINFENLLKKVIIYDLVKLNGLSPEITVPDILSSLNIYCVIGKNCVLDVLLNFKTATKYHFNNKCPVQIITNMQRKFVSKSMNIICNLQV